jgi:hypothetical protein
MTLRADSRTALGRGLGDIVSEARDSRVLWLVRGAKTIETDLPAERAKRTCFPECRGDAARAEISVHDRDPARPTAPPPPPTEDLVLAGVREVVRQQARPRRKRGR